MAQVLRSELDYVQEGRSAERIGASFAGWSELHVPRVHWELTTSRVLTLDLVSGLKVTNRERLDAAGVDRAALARVAARVVMKMVLRGRLLPRRPRTPATSSWSRADGSA